MPRPSFITLFFAIAIAQVLVATSPAANALQGVGLPNQIANRAEHVNINRRMIKQRRAAGDTQDVPINAAADDPPASTTSAPASTSTPANGNNNSRTTTTTSSSQSGGLLGSVSQLLNGSTSSSTTSTTSSTSTISTPSSTSTPQSSSQSSTSTVQSTTRGGSVVYVTASAPESSTSSDPASDPSNSFLPKPVIIGLIVAGSCVVAAAAIWTVIRKWKFSPSRHFEDRLEPINWQPTESSGVDHDPTMAALGRSTSRNGGRPDSFHSGDAHGSVRNMSTAHNDSVTMAPDFPPPHDFTAGPAAGGLNAGYVDMHRGPSPAPSAYGGAYGGQYETPNHNAYDAYDYNAGYGQQQRRY